MKFHILEEITIGLFLFCAAISLEYIVKEIVKYLRNFHQ